MKNRPTILIVDDDESIRDTLEAILQKKYSVLKAKDGKEALEIVEKREVNVMLLDIVMPGISGLEVLKRIKDRFDDIEIIMITVLKEVDTAVQAMKMGAYDYITKEFNYDEIAALVDRAVEKQTLSKELIYLQSERDQYFEDTFILGKTRTMEQIYTLVKKVANLPATILIMGETGTGKELLARLIHRESGNAKTPFVTVHLASIPRELIESNLFGHEKGAFTGAHKQRFGKFELAHKGTIFLDEVGDLKYDIQAKLLRVIQEGSIERLGGSKTIKVDVRLIAATNIDLEKAVQSGEFREDLYYRLNVVPINLPPLRERLIDIPLLVEHFLNKYNRKFRRMVREVTPEALEILSCYPWAGNIRELENLIERLVAIAEKDRMSPEDIPVEYHFPNLAFLKVPRAKENLLSQGREIFERNFILKALEMDNWNRTRTAESLGIPLSTLKFKLSKLNIYEAIGERTKKTQEVKGGSRK